MSLTTLYNVLLRTLSDPNLTAKGSSLTWTEEDTNFKILVDAIKQLSTPDTSGFSPYNNGTTYSNVSPDYVTYDNNVWQYINPVAQSGVTPGSDPLTWQIASLGQFSHVQNTDQYLDLGGPYEVSAEDIYNFLNMGLSDYLKLDGTTVMTGVLDVGNQNITHVDLINDFLGNPSVAVAERSLQYPLGGTTALAWNVKANGLGVSSNSSSIYAFLKTTNLTTNRTFEFPNASGTLATTTDLGSYVPLAGGVTMSGLLVLSGDPSAANGAATKNYVDNLLTGITWKNSVVAATTGNITLSGAQTIDGISVIAGNRVLVKSQSFGEENGIYLCAAGSWTRVLDADTGSELAQATVLVEAGTVNGGTQWNCSNTTITIGVTSVAFVQIAGAGVYTNGTGISLTGNIFSIDSTVVTLTGAQALSNKTGNISQWTNDSGYLTSSTGVTTVNGASGAITNVALTTATLSQFAATTSAQLAGVISDETGTGVLMFGTDPTITGGVTISGNKSAAAWTTAGIGLRSVAATFTDTTSSGTVASQYAHFLAAPTFAASSVTTYTNAYNLFIAPPAAGSNVTNSITYALGISGDMHLNGGNRTIRFSNGVLIDSGAGSSLRFMQNAVNKYIIGTDGNHTFQNAAASSGTTSLVTCTQPANTGGSAGGLLWTAGAHTGQTSGTEIVDINFNIARTVTWLTTVPTTQRFVRITAPTMSCASVSTSTTAATFSIAGAPAAAGSAIITNPYSFWVESGGSLFSGNVTISAANLITDTTTGMKIATATSQKLGVWNATPIVQPTTAIAAATFVANTSGIVNDTATFDGYTIGQIVKALRNIGWLA